VDIKYKKKTYSSADLPIFLYFKSQKSKREFINDLNNYQVLGEFVVFNCIDFAIAGNTVIKDKRSNIYLSLESIEEKKHIQRYMFNSDDESNAVISTPPDIKPRILEEWISKHTKDLI